MITIISVKLTYVETKGFQADKMRGGMLFTKGLKLLTIEKAPKISRSEKIVERKLF